MLQPSQGQLRPISGAKGGGGHGHPGFILRGQLVKFLGGDPCGGEARACLWADCTGTKMTGPRTQQSLGFVNECLLTAQGRGFHSRSSP